MLARLDTAKVRWLSFSLILAMAATLASLTFFASRAAASTDAPLATVKFMASRRNVDMRTSPSTAGWGGVTIQMYETVWFATTDLSHRLIVYFLAPGSPDPGPQYTSTGHTGALFLPRSEFTKWADLVYSGKTVYVRLQSAAPHDHSVSTYNWP